jgi:hypothetical protein
VIRGKDEVIQGQDEVIRGLKEQIALRPNFVSDPEDEDHATTSSMSGVETQLGTPQSATDPNLVKNFTLL